MAKQLQSDSLGKTIINSSPLVHQAVASLQNRILSATKTAGFVSEHIDPQKDIRIFIGSKEVQKEKITSTQIEKICNAIDNPASLENKRSNVHRGTVEIWLREQGKVFRNEWGKVERDLLELSQPGVRLHQTASRSNDKDSQPDIQQVDKRNRSTDQYSHELAALKQVVVQQAERIAILERKLEFISESTKSVQNKSLSRWLSSAVSQTSKGFKQGLESWASEKLEVVQQMMVEAKQPTRTVRYFDALDLEEPQVSEPVEVEPKTEHLSQVREQLEKVEGKIWSVSHRFAQKMAELQQVVEPAAFKAIDYSIDSIDRYGPTVVNAINRTADAVERARPVVEAWAERTSVAGQKLLLESISKHQSTQVKPCQVNSMSESSPRQRWRLGSAANRVSQLVKQPKLQHVKSIIENLKHQQQKLVELHSSLHRDSDGDGITNAQERAYGTNPYSIDTDWDGRTDLEEINSGSSPQINNESHQQKKPLQKEEEFSLDL